jgi:hypothetical protein
MHFKNARPASKKVDEMIEIDHPIVPSKREPVISIEKEGKPGGKKKRKKRKEEAPVEIVKSPVKKKGRQKSMFDFIKKKNEVVRDEVAEVAVAAVIKEIEECIDLTGEPAEVEDIMADVNPKIDYGLDVVDVPMVEDGIECVSASIVVQEPEEEIAVVGEEPTLEFIDLTSLTSGVEDVLPGIIEESVDESIDDSCTVMIDKGKERKKDDPPSPPDDKKTLVVLEECDILFAPDKAFWTAILSILTSSKSPVIFTANGKSA